MASDDIEYGWHSFLFGLEDIVLTTSATVEEPYKSSDWIEREPEFALTLDSEEEKQKAIDAFESQQSLKITHRRRLSGLLVLDDFDTQFYLGVPKPESSPEDLSKARLEKLRLTIREREGESVRETIKSGGITSSRSGVFLTLDVPSETFALIERAISQPNISALVGVNLKGWYRLLYTGSDYYVNEKKREPAELQSFQASKIIDTFPNYKILDRLDDYSEPVEEAQQSQEDLISLQLQALSQSVESIKTAAWLVVVAVAAVFGLFLF